VLFAVGDIVEEKAPARFFRQASKLPADERLKLGIFVDFTMDSVQLVFTV
jgi:hypothetical protein